VVEITKTFCQRFIAKILQRLFYLKFSISYYMEFLRKQFSNFSPLHPLSICFIFSLTVLSAQPTAVKTDVTDPKAKAFLDKVKKQYEGYATLEMKFKLETKMAEQPKADVESGKIAQQGDRYRVDMDKDKNFIISDGKIIWQRTGNLVRIMNASGKAGNELLSPKDLMKIYEKKDYAFGITGERAEAWSGKATVVTLKPVNNRRSDYTKIEIAIDQKTNHIVSVTAFSRDQSRYKLTMDPPATNQKQDINKFVFDKSKYPGVKVEDLRID
jgi:outer membrane lipoprotein carrier protein